MALPFPALSSHSIRLSSDYHPDPFLDRPAASTAAALQRLLTLTYKSANMEQLIWDPVAAHNRRVCAEEIYGFQEELLDWAIYHAQLLPDLNVVTDINGPLENDWQIYLLPPQECRTNSLHARLAAAHYNFYMGRMKWALCVLDRDAENNELSAYFHFYQAMRFTTQVEEPVDNTKYCPPEGLKIGFLPLLHIIGLCCPQPSWLQWIQSTCGLLQQEGIFKGHTFSTNLDCFHVFELYGKSNLPTTLAKYPAPASRTVSQLIPEPDGRHYVSYFARPKLINGPTSDEPDALSPLGHARWKCNLGEHPCSPDLHMYGEKTPVSEFSEWLSSKPVAIAWREWATHSEFTMERALQDHINGARLLPAPEDTEDVPI
jgi:hypothetical protein